MDGKELGVRIKTGRMSRNMTQADLAEALGVAPSTVGMWEQGRREPDLDSIEALADIYNVPMSFFIEQDDVRRLPNDVTQFDIDRLEALHQNPKLGLLFDRQRKLSEKDIDIMLSIVERIQKEVEN